MRAGGQPNAGLQQFSKIGKGHAIFRVVEKVGIESDLRKHERRVEFVLPKYGWDREERPHSDILVSSWRRVCALRCYPQLAILWNLPWDRVCQVDWSVIFYFRTGSVYWPLVRAMTVCERIYVGYRT